MTKQEAIKAASNLLQRIYHDDSGVPNDATIAILNAEAEENAYYLWSALNEVVKFCKKLQEAIKEK